MIPQGRPVMTEAEMAEAAGMALTTWRRREAPALRQRIQPVNPEDRLKLYDRAQVTAYMAGKPIPSRPTGEEPHPDDLLSTPEAAAALGVTASTVRGYTTEGYLTGTEIAGTRWYTRREIEARAAAGDQRHGPRTATERRTAEVAQWLADAAAGTRPPVSADDVMSHYGLGERAARQTLAQARKHAGS
ncbi:DNA-binding protein [Streptomyces sp. NPDC001633]|uniref:DNA-binding protein n=1 Tax=Streptomyces sp. NPDC001633 TaxID=3364595 RepID=UPI0036907731